MVDSMATAKAFGEYLRDNPAASRAYDACTPEQRHAILLHLDTAPSFASLLSCEKESRQQKL